MTRKLPLGLLFDLGRVAVRIGCDSSRPDVQQHRSNKFGSTGPHLKILLPNFRSKTVRCSALNRPLSYEMNTHVSNNITSGSLRKTALEPKSMFECDLHVSRNRTNLPVTQRVPPFGCWLAQEATPFVEPCSETSQTTVCGISNDSRWWDQGRNLSKTPFRLADSANAPQTSSIVGLPGECTQPCTKQVNEGPGYCVFVRQRPSVWLWRIGNAVISPAASSHIHIAAASPALPRTYTVLSAPSRVRAAVRAPAAPGASRFEAAAVLVIRWLLCGERNSCSR